MEPVAQSNLIVGLNSPPGKPASSHHVKNSYPSVLTSCYKCETEITFDDEYVSERTGKKIPLDGYTLEPHRCPMYKAPKKYKPCLKCGALIYFDEDAPKSVNGKWVPQDQRTGQTHQCPENDYDKLTFST
ncbi:hypothetical protein BH18THE2_BH18THE2_14630 [soil metagenome]